MCSQDLHPHSGMLRGEPGLMSLLLEARGGTVGQEVQSKVKGLLLKARANDISLQTLNINTEDFK